MKSASAMLLPKTEIDIWHRGELYADKGLVNIINVSDKKIQAVVKGTKKYDIILKFPPKGISVNCSCPYFTKNSQICKHLVAAAIIWDEKQGIPRPSQARVEQGSVPPPALSRKDINKLFSKPLEADLDDLRILPEVTAMGGYVRPHSQLPKVPNIALDEDQPLTHKEMQKCYSEFRKWSQRKAYDPYFCSGEMVAAFCELLIAVKRRLAATPPLIAAQVLLDAQEFNCTLVTELEDDSQGLHEFSEAYLDSICDCLRTLIISENERARFERLLNRFDERRGKY